MSHETIPDQVHSDVSIVAWASGSLAGDRPPLVSFMDPLEEDRPDDPVIVITHRQLGRLIFMAAETGARFSREAADVDPAAWMSAPRRIFEGRNAVTACTEREMFVRALILHGVSPGLDMNPEEVDLLLEDAGSVTDTNARAQAGRADESSGSSKLTLIKRRLLFTASAADESPTGIGYVFYAVVAADEDEVRDQLRSRAGARLAYTADVDVGFDASEPIAMALLSDAMADLINHVAEDPCSPLSAGFRLFVEHRFEE